MEEVKKAKALEPKVAAERFEFDTGKRMQEESYNKIKGRKVEYLTFQTVGRIVYSALDLQRTDIPREFNIALRVRIDVERVLAKPGKYFSLGLALAKITFHKLAQNVLLSALTPAHLKEVPAAISEREVWYDDA